MHLISKVDISIWYSLGFRGLAVLGLLLSVVAGRLVAVDSVPVVTYPSTSSAWVGQAFTARIVATGNPTSYAATGLAEGLTIETTAGMIVGAPTMVGSYQVNLAASNAVGTGTAIWPLIVQGQAATLPLGTPVSRTLPPKAKLRYQVTLVTTATLAIDLEGAPTSRGTLVDPYLRIYDATGTTLLSSDDDSGVGFNAQIVRTFTPGSYLIEVSAVGSSGGTFQLQAMSAPGNVPVITTTSPVEVLIGEAFRLQLQTAKPAISFTSGNLPPGLALNVGTGLISGTPLANLDTWDVQITATNDSGTDTKVLSFTTTYRQPGLSAASLSEAIQGEPYLVQIPVVGVVQGYVVEGLPDGLHVDAVTGLISGRAQRSGSFTLTCTVAGPGGATTGILALVVNDPLQPITVGETVVGELAFPGAVDGFALELDHPSAVAFTLNGVGSGLGTLSVPRIQILDRSTTATMGSSLADGLDPTLTTWLAAGSYLIRVSGSGVGTYHLQALENHLYLDPVTGWSAWVGRPFRAILPLHGTPTALTVTGLPPGLLLDPETGTISGTPTELGHHTIQIQVQDGTTELNRAISLTVHQPLNTLALGEFVDAHVAFGTENAYQFTLLRRTSVVLNLESYGGGLMYWGSSLEVRLLAGDEGQMIAGPGLNYVSAINGYGLQQILDPGTYLVMLRATYGREDCRLRLREFPPVLVGLPRSISVRVGETVAYRVFADNQPTAFQFSNLPNGLIADMAKGVISGKPTAAGSYRIGISASNSGGTVSSTLSLLVLPAILSIAPGESLAGEVTETTSLNGYNLTLASRTSLRLSAGGAASGMGTLPRIALKLFRNQTNPNSPILIADADPLTGLVDESVDLDAGEYVVEVFSRDAATGTYRLTVDVLTLRLSGPATLLAVVGQPVAYQIPVVGTAQIFTAVGLPVGLVVNSETGLITGTPLSSGSTTAVFAAGNAAGTFTRRQVIQVIEPVPALQLGQVTYGSISGASEIQRYVLDLAQEVTVQFDLYGAASGRGTLAAPQLTLRNPVTGERFSGSNQASSLTEDALLTRRLTPGRYLVEITGTTSSPSGYFALRAGTGVITNSGSISVLSGVPFSCQITTADPVRSFSSVGLPEGLSLDPDTGIISGVAQGTGPRPVQLSTVDAHGGSAMTWTLTLLEGERDIVLGEVRGGQFSDLWGSDRYRLILDAPTVLVLRVRADVLGQRPLGNVIIFLLRDDGSTVTVRSGAPTTADGVRLMVAVPAGTYHIRVNSGNSLGGAYRLSVTASGVQVVQPAQASGWANFPFSTQIGIFGSATGYAAEGLPLGLTCDPVTGGITGVPQQEGVFPVAITATAGDESSTGLMEIRIAATPTPLTLNTTLLRDCPVGFREAFRLDLANPGKVLIDFGTVTTFFYGLLDRRPVLTITDGTGRVLAKNGLEPGSWFSTTYRTSLHLDPGRYLFAVEWSESRFPADSLSLWPSQSSAVPYRLDVHLAAPVITSLDTARAVIGAPFVYAIAAVNDPLRFTADQLPMGLTLDEATGVISGTVLTQQSLQIMLRATNDGGTGSLRLHFTAGPPPPTLSVQENQVARVGQPFSYQVVADGLSPRFAADGLPSGLTIDPETGLISGTPTHMGQAMVQLLVSNAGGSAQADLVIQVLPGPPYLPALLIATGQIGQSFSLTIDAGSPCVYAASMLPAGLTMDPVTGIISGQPGEYGSWTIQLSAENAGGTATAELALVILPPAPQLPERVVSECEIDQPYQMWLPMDGFPKTYSAVDLPPGLILDPEKGIVTGAVASYGSWTAHIYAENAGGKAEMEFLFRVPLPAPELVIGNTLQGQVGVSMAHVLAARRTLARYEASNLPSGLVLDHDTGLLSGMPTAPGSWISHVVAQNASGQAEVDLFIEVLPLAPVLVAGRRIQARVGEALQIVTAGNPDQVALYGALGLPLGLTINPDSGVISGTPLQSGSVSIQVQARNPGGSAMADFHLAIGRAVMPLRVDEAVAGVADPEIGADLYRIDVAVPGWVSFRFGVPGKTGLVAGLSAILTDAQGQQIGMLTAGGSLECRLSVGFINIVVAGPAGANYQISITDANVEAFVGRFYRQCLQREPESTGLVDWSRRLRSRELSGGDLARGFILSQEFLGRGLDDAAYLKILYRAFFDREPDAGGMAGWQRELAAGMLREDVLYGFILAQEFTNLTKSYAITPVSEALLRHHMVRQFVRRFYKNCLIREPDAAGINSWVAALEDGSAAGSQVALGFLLSPEFIARHVADEPLVDLLYGTFFERPGDPSGRNGWIVELVCGIPRKIVFDGFIHSGEFSNLCARYGIIPFPSGG